MNNKIKNYVDVLFSDIPRTKKAIELKEEILSNLSERYDDYIKEGKSETQAYSLAVSNMGDVDEMLETVKPSEDFINGANKYRKRNARNTAIAVVIYILAIISFLTLGMAADIVGNMTGSFVEDILAMVALVSMFALAAGATAILIYTYMSVPIEYKDYNDSEQKVYKKANPERKRFDSIMSIYWLAVTLVYLTISFTTHSWGITWIIWPIAGIVGAIIDTLFEMRENNER